MRQMIIRPITGCPVLWKDLRSPVFGKSKIRRRIRAVILIVIAAIVYISMAAQGVLDDDDVHIGFAVVYGLIGIFLTAVIAATGITLEKEARSWPLLLSTTLDDRQILRSKWIATLRWCLPVWVLLFGHVLLFTLVGKIHPLALVHLAVTALGVLLLLTGTGLYWSSRLNRTTAAVICNFIVPLLLWGLIPIIWSIFQEIGPSGGGGKGLERYLSFNPVVQVVVVADACASEGWGRLRPYNWPQGRVSVGMSTGLLLGSLCVYGLLGLAFAWVGKSLFRRKIF